MAVSLGGHAVGSTASGTTTVATAAFATQPTAGSTIVVAVLDGADAFVLPTGISDNAGNTYVACGAGADVTQDVYRASLWYAKNISTAASFVVTATWASTAGMKRIAAAEIKGAHLTAPLDQVKDAANGNVVAGTDAVSTGASGATSEAGEFVFAAFMSQAVGSFDSTTAGTGFTRIDRIDIGDLETEYLIQGAAGTATGTLSFTGADGSWFSLLATFKEAAAAGTNLYFLDSAASGSNFGQLQVGGSAPSTATTATGWTVDTVGATNYALMAYASERASTVFSGTAQPAGNPDNSLGDCFRSTSTMSGDFATGVWTIAVPVIAVSAAAGQDGRVRVRLWKSANATGTSPTEITSGAVAGTTVTNLTTGAEQVSTVTTGSITGFSMANEYLFVQIAWEITGAAT